MLNKGFLAKMAPPPVVTGISPKEGPPGTRVTVRGEFLGARAQDLKGLFYISLSKIKLAMILFFWHFSELVNLRAPVKNPAFDKTK